MSDCVDQLAQKVDFLADRFQVWLGPLRGSHGNKLVGLFHILFTEDLLQVASV